MALSQHDLLRLLESLRSADGIELVRSVAERMLQELVEAEATARIGAGWNEHTDTRTAFRNGHRDKTLTTQAGDLDLAIPKLRSGSFFPALLERRRRIDQALYAVIMEAYVHGVSTRSVDDLVKALARPLQIAVVLALQPLLVRAELLLPPDHFRIAGDPIQTHPAVEERRAVGGKDPPVQRDAVRVCTCVELRLFDE